MDWIIENLGGISQILVAAYALARAITALTPSDKDNELVAKIAKVFGLDRKEGVK